LRPETAHVARACRVGVARKHASSRRAVDHDIAEALADGLYAGAPRFWAVRVDAAERRPHTVRERPEASAARAAVAGIRITVLRALCGHVLWRLLVV
jgi:hypothetical protein